MRVEVVSINQVFVNNRVLKIPFFQRGYVWKEDNWKQFFDDIANVADIEDGENPEMYFLGSIILKNSGLHNDGVQIYDVIDGQQRLTTIVIFMKALFLALGHNDIFKTEFMQTSLLTGETKPILVTNYNDQAVYNQIINADSLSGVPAANDSLLSLAFTYFRDRIQDANNPANGEPAISPMKILTSVRSYVRLVSIEVQDGDNAQKIFETINCSGIRLTTGEMLKNFLFDENSIDNYERTWKPVFENNQDQRKYWEGNTVNGRIKDSHIENFFYRYMLIKMQEPNIRAKLTPNEIKTFRQKEGLFEKFRQLIYKCDIDKQSAINDIVEYAQLYLNTFKANMLEEPLVRYYGIERLAYYMYAQNSWTMTPYILYILHNVDDTERTRIFRYMENYLMRRTICKSTNNNYSDMFSENLIGQSINTYNAFVNYVNDAEKRGSLLMPSDNDVVNAVMTNDLKNDAKTILYLLESRVNNHFTNSTHNNCYTSFTTEQIMPERHNDGWALANGFDINQRNDLTKTLGNFILLREKLKSRDRNADWIQKRNAMSPKVAELELFQIVNNGLDSFDDSTIVERNRWLAGKVLEVWPK